MKHIAVIAGYEYRFIEMFSSVEDSSQFVLCANPDGKKFICPVDFWLSHTEAAASEPVAPINTGSTAQEKITFFLSLYCINFLASVHIRMFIYFYCSMIGLTIFKYLECFPQKC